MDKNKFDKKYSEKVVDKIILSKPDMQYSTAYRIAKVPKGQSPTFEDMLPSFIKHCGKKFPPIKTQDELLSKNDLEFFGTSLFTDLEKCKQFGCFVPSERKNSIIKGSTKENHGSCTKANENTHFVYYLYNPFDSNIVNDFESFIEKEKENG